MSHIITLRGLEQYRDTALAIGLVELLGNDKPNDSDISIAETIVKRLKLSWDDCRSTSSLKKAIKSRVN